MKTPWKILICMWIYFIHGAVNVNGTFKLTSSPLTATDGELITLTCSFHGESAVNIWWLLNNNAVFVSQVVRGCIKQQLAYGYDIINRTNVGCNSTSHSIAFRYNSTTDQGSAWQCGNSVNDTKIYPRSNNYTIDLVMSTLSLSITTRYMKTTSDPGTMTTKNASSGGKDPNRLYIAVGAVGGAVLLTVVVVGFVCIRRKRKAAHQQNDMKEERKASPVYQNTTGNNTVENDLYEGSRDVQPMNAAENQEDDLMLSDAYASVAMPVTNTCAPREEVPSGDVNLENLYAKPDKSKDTEVQHDIYAVVQKPKKKKQKE